jgi:cell division protein FtsL
MSIDLEYAVRKDIRNNPLVREVDVQQKREFNRLVWLVTVVVAMLLFSAWQHFELVNNGYKVERLRLEKAAEESFNRKLRLELETMRRPQSVESFAVKQLRMVAPTSADTLVIERTTASAPARSVIASNR